MQKNLNQGGLTFDLEGDLKFFEIRILSSDRAIHFAIGIYKKS